MDEGHTADSCDSFFGRHKFAEITVDFNPVNISKVNLNKRNPLIFTEEINPSYEYINTSADKYPLYYDNNQEDPLPSGGLVRQSLQYVWTLSYPSLPEFPDNWVNLEGTTNADTITRSEFNVTFEPETLLVYDVSGSSTISPDGDQQISFNFAAKYRKSGWNNIDIFENGKLKAVPVYDGNGDVIKTYFPEFNFEDILPGL